MRAEFLPKSLKATTRSQAALSKNSNANSLCPEKTAIPDGTGTTKLPEMDLPALPLLLTIFLRVTNSID